MHLTLVELDERVFALNRAEVHAPKRVRERLSAAMRLGWLYHQLQLEGVVVEHGDLKRALRGHGGDDYCDTVLLDRIRAFDRVRDYVRSAADDRQPLNERFVRDILAILERVEGDINERTFDGATEQYKHDVTPAAALPGQLAETLARFEQRSMLENPISLAVELHYELIKLWPFTRFSALIARLSADLLLMRSGYPAMLLHASDRRRYYHAMHYDISRLRDLQLEAIQAVVALRGEFLDRYVERANRRRISVA